MPTISKLLSAHAVFSALEPAQITFLCDLSITRAYTKGEFITLSGDFWPYLFLVAEGAVNAVKESIEGRSLLVASFGSGELFWGLAFFDDHSPMPVTLCAVEPTLIYLWSQEALLPFLLKNGKVSWELSRLMVQRMLRASEIVEDLAFQPVAGRLARFLVEYFGEREMDRVARNLTLDEMAAHIGSTREMVCRILQRFSNQGFIDITRTEFVFTDREGLSQLARKSSG